MLVSLGKVGIFALLALGFAACSGSEFTPGGEGTGGADGGGGTSGASGSGGGTPCGENGGRCAPPAPEGWAGPVALVKNAECGEDFPNEVFERFTGLNRQPAGCHCKCELNDVSCNNPGQIQFYKEADCLTGCEFQPISASSCQSIKPSNYCTGAGVGFKFMAKVTGGCTSKQVMTLEPPTWSDTVRGCQAPSPAACENGLCLPKLPGGATQICIYKDGADVCPADYFDGFKAFGGFDDNRDCAGNCGCGSPYCGKATFFNDAQCTDPIGPEGPAPLGVCGPTPQISTWLAYKDEIGCEPTGDFAPTPGDVTEKETITVCCLGAN